MYSYEIWVRSNKYHGSKPLTYTSTQKIVPGAVVKIDLKNNSVFGFVRRQAPAPKSIAMKPIEHIFYNGMFTLPKQHIKLFSWMLNYYPNSSGSLTQLFLPSQLITTPTPTISNHCQIKNPPPLTDDQTKIINNINYNSGSTILHGNTGTGKTRIYLELINKTLSSKRSCLILVPEIGLTPQISEQISTFIGTNRVKTIHSNLSIKSKAKIWHEIISSNVPLVVIGPRSAIFTPINNLGLIVADECHDDSYQQENSPAYHGLRVASKLAELHDAMMVYGSATPTINDIFLAKKRNVPIFRMTKPAVITSTSKVDKIIIDKKNKSEFTKSKSISNTLIDKINIQLTKNRQSLIFLNRRGSARVIMCSTCNWRAQCQNCELPLTFHADSHIIRCHTCGFSKKAPTNCPICKSSDIYYIGPGTKTIEKELSGLFPAAKIARFDSDNIKKESLENNLISILNGKIDILIGTQVLIKGFDIPKLGLVGIVDADTSLSFPDFTTEEKTYQMINQAVGRVGRGHTRGTVVLQTYYPKSSLIMQAVNNKWQDFYQSQLSLRKEHNFPPFVFILKLIITRKKRESCIVASEKLIQSLNQIPSVTILGPSPSYKEKSAGSYCWQIIIKSALRSDLLKIISILPSGWKYYIDPNHLL
jgi:primosomal protein N' (replication factor Y)